jgi:hypothetical protein
MAWYKSFVLKKRYFWPEATRRGKHFPARRGRKGPRLQELDLGRIVSGT